MRKIFQKWLFVVIMAAFVVTFGISFFIQTKHAEKSAANMIRIKIGDVKKQLLQNEKNLQSIREDCAKNSIENAKTFAYILTLAPEVAKTPETLKKVAHIIGVDELNVIDGKGFITASTEPRFLGFAMADSEQSSWFLPLLTDTSLELVQDPHVIGYDGAYSMQYAAVTRMDGPGFVQIGYKPERLYHAMAVADIKNIAPGFRIGNEGSVIIIRDNVVVSSNASDQVGKDIREIGFQPNELNKETNFFKKTLKDSSVLIVFEHFGDFIILGRLPAEEIFIGRNTLAYFLILCNMVLYGIVFVAISFLVQHIVINGIYKINLSLAKITKGDLNEQVNVTTNDEFRSLSGGINATVVALKKAIAAAAARLDAELGFAKTIQSRSLPCVFPPFPDRKEFDIFASMNTAKEVGGDFYDFFFIDTTHLAVVIADVSGKGIPAALFMMTAKAQIKNTAESGLPPKDVFTKANNHLCENNETGMFVTAFLGILDTQTGDFTYVNGGHNPPLLRRKNGDFSFLKPIPGFVLAGLPDFQYKQDTLHLNPGDTLFFYTDGVTEALNSDQKLYSEQRLEKTLNATAKDARPKALISAVLKSVTDYAAGTEQADDITMLSLTYLNGPSS